MRHTDKGKRFEGLIERADNALVNNYCIEASTIYYAVLEERFISVFEKLGINLNQDQKMKYCIDELKKMMLNGYNFKVNETEERDIGNLISSSFDIQLLDKIHNWRKTRNRIIHDFAKQDIEYAVIESWASEGKVLLRQLTSSIMRFKNQLKKIS